MPDNRKFSRVNFKIESKFISSKKTFGIKVINISLKGLLAEIGPAVKREDIETGTIEIRLINSDIVLTFEAELIHFQDSLTGYRFIKTDSESITHLRRLLELNTGNPNQIDSEIFFLVD